ncbi:hypothetical protein CYMTET_33198, partial [Cymbomonas tetramitiformis]
VAGVRCLTLLRGVFPRGYVKRSMRNTYSCDILLAWTLVRSWRRSSAWSATTAAEDWTPTETSRKYKMFERLDPDFYAAVRVRYPMSNDLRPVPLSVPLTDLITHICVSWERQQAELGGAVGPKVSGPAYSGMDSKIVEVLGQLTTRLEKIEAAIKFQRLGASSQPPKRQAWQGAGWLSSGREPDPARRLRQT